MNTEQLLLILSRRGWDRVGKPTAKCWEFRHGGTGEEIQIAPGELPFWVAQVDPSIISPPSGDDDWYAEWRYGFGWAEVKSRTGRREVGVTHDKQGYFLFFPMMKDAEKAAALLNLRDKSTVDQLELEL